MCMAVRLAGFVLIPFYSGFPFRLHVKKFPFKLKRLQFKISNLKTHLKLIKKTYSTV